MAGFNRSGFNRAPFNRPSKTTVEIAVEPVGSSTVEVVIEAVQNPAAEFIGSSEVSLEKTTEVMNSAAEAVGSSDVSIDSTTEIIHIGAEFAGSSDVSLPKITEVINIAAEAAGSSALEVLFDGEFKQESRFNGTIPPGSTLVITSCGYKVTLDGRDVFEQYDGRLFLLMPDSREIEIRADNAAVAMEVKINYEPEYK